tara:strand:+ start:281 stop:544 length:264 start_codon:yes stop_codon:yes gene_type:complete
MYFPTFVMTPQYTTTSQYPTYNLQTIYPDNINELIDFKTQQQAVQTQQYYQNQPYGMSQYVTPQYVTPQYFSNQNVSWKVQEDTTSC